MQDPELRQALVDEAETADKRLRAIQAGIGGDPAGLIIQSVGTHEDLEHYVGRSVGDIAAEQGKHKIEVMLDLSLAGDLNVEFLQAEHEFNAPFNGELLTASPYTLPGVSDGPGGHGHSGHGYGGHGIPGTVGQIGGVNAPAPTGVTGLPSVVGPPATSGLPVVDATATGLPGTTTGSTPGAVGAGQTEGHFTAGHHAAPTSALAGDGTPTLAPGETHSTTNPPPPPPVGGGLPPAGTPATPGAVGSGTVGGVGPAGTYTAPTHGLHGGGAAGIDPNALRGGDARSWMLEGKMSWRGDEVQAPPPVLEEPTSE